MLLLLIFWLAYGPKSALVLGNKSWGQKDSKLYLQT